MPKVVATFDRFQSVRVKESAPRRLGARLDGLPHTHSNVGRVEIRGRFGDVAGDLSRPDAFDYLPCPPRHRSLGTTLEEPSYSLSLRTAALGMATVAQAGRADRGAPTARWLSAPAAPVA